LIVDGEVGGDEGVKEGEAGRLLGCGIILMIGFGSRVSILRDEWVAVGLREFVGGGILEIPIWVIFNDYDIKFDTDGIYVFATLDAKCTAGWILANAGFQVSPVFKQSNEQCLT